MRFKFLSVVIRMSIEKLDQRQQTVRTWDLALIDG